MPWSPFSKLPAPTPDAIYAITAEAKAAGPEAINGTIGVFMDEEGKPAMFGSIKSAIQELGEGLTRQSFSYPALFGLPEFRESVSALILGDAPFTPSGFAATGGTGAVKLNLELLKLMLPSPKIILPVPAWVNHKPMCVRAGFQVAEVQYLSADCRPRIDQLIAAIDALKEPSAILLQAGCHNPTGLDFSAQQWKDISDHLARRDVIALMDFAYQGFGAEPDHDARPIRIIADAGVPVLVSWSSSKNHCIYSERCGLACALAGDALQAKVIEGHYMTLTRSIHSAAPVMGQRIVSLVQKKYKKEWLADIAAARAIMQRKREVLGGHFTGAFKNAINGTGMFALLPLKSDQVARLKTEHKVFLTGDGRINIAGIPLKRIEELARAIAAVIG